jgi:hypothetical protein
MPNPENLKGKGFDKHPEHISGGKPKGAKNRSTILRKWLEAPMKVVDPNTGETVKGTFEDKIIIALLNKGGEGDVPAIREALDTIYGKNKETLELDEKLTIEWKETKTYLKNDTDS